MYKLTKKLILERQFDVNCFFLPGSGLNEIMIVQDLLSLPQNRRDFWMRLNRIYQLSRIGVTSKSKNSLVLHGNPFRGEVSPKNWYLTPDQLIDGIEKYISHLLLDYEWELLNKIKKYKCEGRKIRGIQELLYWVNEFSGSLLYMSPQEFVEKHNKENPHWKWSYDEVRKDVDFFHTTIN